MQIRFEKRKLSVFLLLLMCGLVLWLFPSKAEAATVPVTVRIPVSCDGGNPSETFTFVLDMETRDFQKPDQMMIRMKAGEEGAYTIHYGVPGTYHYKIRQEAGANKKSTYDTTVYQVDVYVTEDEKGVLQADPVIYLDGSKDKKAEVHFTNSGWSEPSKTSRSGAVKTGDSTDFAVYVMLLIASATTLAVLFRVLFIKRKG